MAFLARLPCTLCGSGLRSSSHLPAPPSVGTGAGRQGGHSFSDGIMEWWNDGILGDIQELRNYGIYEFSNSQSLNS
jgi:hypothetical protein